MADRLTALAGFHDSSVSMANTTGSPSKQQPLPPPGLESDGSISLMPPPPTISARTASNGPTASGSRPKTPPPASTASGASRQAAVRSSTLQVPPSTTRKADSRRRYGVTIGGLASDLRAAGGLAPFDDDDDEDEEGEGRGAGGYDDEEGEGTSGKSMESDVDLRKVREQLMMVGSSTSAKGGRVGELRRQRSRGALGDVTNASSVAGDATGNNSRASGADGAALANGSAGAEDSGQWGTRALNRRVAQGTNLKQLQGRIDSLTAERDDLKIEVDFHRRRGSLGDIATEVIALRQEKLTYVKKVMNLNDLVKKQDKAMTLLRKANKFWEGKKVEDWHAMEEQIRASRAERDRNEKERKRLEDEIDFLKTLREERSREENSRRDRSLAGGAGDEVSSTARSVCSRKSVSRTTGR